MRWSSVKKMNKPAMTTAASANPGAEQDLVTPRRVVMNRHLKHSSSAISRGSSR